MITKRQIIDKLNALTDDPDEEIFVLWDTYTWEIHDIGLEDDGNIKKICIDCSN